MSSAFTSWLTGAFDFITRSLEVCAVIFRAQTQNRVRLQNQLHDSVLNCAESLLSVYFSTLCGWLINIFAPLSQPMRRKTETSWCLARTRFPALGAGHMYSLRVLIGCDQQELFPWFWSYRTVFTAQSKLT